MFFRRRGSGEKGGGDIFGKSRIAKPQAVPIGMLMGDMKPENVFV